VGTKSKAPGPASSATGAPTSFTNMSASPRPSPYADSLAVSPLGPHRDTLSHRTDMVFSNPQLA
jgi:hypothetical protein